MSGFTIPNTPDAPNQNQAEPDSLDFQILGKQVNGVVSGMTVTEGSGESVNVASGEVLINGSYYPFAGITALPLTAYSTSNFFDLVIARVSSGTVSCVVLQGNGGTNPRFPSTVNHTTDVVLAAVWRDGITVSASSLTDKRVFVRSSTVRMLSDTVSANRGSAGDLYVNTAWTASATSTASPLSVKVGSSWYNLAYWPANASITTTGNLTATTFIGNLTGNVTGNVTGNLTGNVTGLLNTFNTDTNSNANTIVVRNGNGGINATDISSFQTIAASHLGTSTINAAGDVNGYNFYALFGGSAGAPDFSWGSYTNYGMYLGGTLKIGFAIAGTLRYIIDSSGGANASSRRYKEDIQDATVNASDLLNIRLADYRPIGSEDRATGVIAEELAEIDSCRQFVIFDEDGNPDAVAYDRLAVAYIELLKDHESRLQALENAAG